MRFFLEAVEIGGFRLPPPLISEVRFSHVPGRALVHLNLTREATRQQP